MNELEQLENQIAKLSTEDRARLRNWFLKLEGERGGSQAQADRGDAGADDLVDESLADFGSGAAKAAEGSRSDTLLGALRRAASHRH